MSRWIGTAALLAALTVAAPAGAQQTQGAQQGLPQVAPLTPEPEGFTFTPFVDIGFAGSLDNSPAGIGGALGYGISNRMSVEGELAFTPDAEVGALAEFDTTLWAVSGNVLYHFTGEDFTPYVTFGLSTLGANAEEEVLAAFGEDEVAWDLGFNWGGGFKTATSERFGFRGDIRYFNGDEIVPDHWRVYGGLVIRQLR